MLKMMQRQSVLGKASPIPEIKIGDIAEVKLKGIHEAIQHQILTEGVLNRIPRERAEITKRDQIKGLA